MSTEEPEAPQRPGGPQRRRARKVSPRSLENAALHYLRRYAASVSQLRRVLTRRIDRSLRVHGGERSEAVRWLDELVERLIRSGLIDDAAYAATKAHALRAGGRSTRVIALKLRQKGVSAELVQQKVALAHAELSELQAARIWARKKRLGPFRRGTGVRRERRDRDLAALARAGFPFAIARQVIDGDAVDGDVEDGAH